MDLTLPCCRLLSTENSLVFLGSNKYPYKGILDNLANRAFAAGTNAWTANDHTAYTIETAGKQGFLQFLPIYVDHILYPTMTNTGFVTEVHHINPNVRTVHSARLLTLFRRRSVYCSTSIYILPPLVGPAARCWEFPI